MLTYHLASPDTCTCINVREAYSRQSSQELVHRILCDWPWLELPAKYIPSFNLTQAGRKCLSPALICSSAAPGVVLVQRGLSKFMVCINYFYIIVTVEVFPPTVWRIIFKMLELPLILMNQTKKASSPKMPTTALCCRTCWDRLPRLQCDSEREEVCVPVHSLALSPFFTVILTHMLLFCLLLQWFCTVDVSGATPDLQWYKWDLNLICCIPWLPITIRRKCQVR